MKRNATRSLLLLLLLAAGYCLQAQTIRYVKEGGTGDGSSWSHASSDLQGMINASSSGDEVWVAKGTYKPTVDYYNNSNPPDPRNKTFIMKGGVGIYGGFAGSTETQRSQRNWKVNVTILSGDIGTPNDNSDNCYTVVENYQNSLDNTAVLDGFTVTGANGGAQYGAGMYNTSSSPLIANCMFLDNLGTAYGAGVKNYYCSPTFTNCVFSGNSAQIGAGLFNVLASPQLTNCAFIGNSAATNGGGMWNQGSSPTLTNCTFSGNTAPYGGGAIYNYTTSVASSPTLTNCILWGDGGGEIANYGSSTATTTYSIVQGGYDGTGNLNQDPLFVSATDLHLQSCSPAIDAGNDAANSTTQDLDANPRKVRTIDMGAYEYQGSPGTAPSITTQLLATQAVCQNSTPVQLKVVADGSSLTYQWYSNTTNSNSGGTVLDGATTDSYLPPTTTTGTQYYYVVVSSNCGSVTSTVAAITVNTSPNRLYVNASATGANTGLSWQDAFTDLQSALNYTCLTNLTEIWVAKGTYYPTNGTDRTISFSMKNGVAIYGGFAGTETQLSQRNWKINITTLSGDIGTTGDNSDNSYRVVYNNNNGLDHTAVLDGFTITGGNANSSFPNYYGGGMCNSGSSPTLTNLVFVNNSANYSGGGMYDYNSNPTLTNVWFQNNHSGNSGGGMYNSNSQPTLVNVAFINNSATYDGGAMNNYNLGPTLINVSFQGNSAQVGGAMATYYCQPILTNCVFWNNGGAQTFFDYIGDSPAATYSLFDATVTGGATGGTGNRTTTTSPFVSTTSVALNSCAPAIDAGLNSAVPSTVITDIDGNPRISNATGQTTATVDMGAYEFVGSALSTFYQDHDGDGYGDAAHSIQACSQPANYVTNNTDCDDTNSAINPATVWYKDADGDGYSDGTTLVQCTRPVGYKLASELTATSGDCDDTQATVHPGAPEICGNGIDDNCNGQIDEGCTLPTTVTVYPSAAYEGNSGKKYMYFLLLLNRAAPADCEVEFETHNGTAKAGSDYQSKTTEVHFTKGQWFKLVGVYIYGDRTVEANETFQVELEEGEHVTIGGSGTATGTIINDDGQRTETQLATGETLNKVPEEDQTLIVPNLLHRAQLWRIPNLPGRNQVTVVDMNGRTVLQAVNYANNRAFNNAASGMYFYQIITTDTNGQPKTYRGKLLIVE